MKEKRLRKKFEELSTRVNKAFKYNGFHGAVTCDAYRRVVDEMKTDAIKFILEELSEHSYWLDALEKITQMKSSGHNTAERVHNWIEWGKINLILNIREEL